jgi:hypothetical protein
MVGLAVQASKGSATAAQTLFNIIVRLARGESPDEIFKPLEQAPAPAPTTPASTTEADAEVSGDLDSALQGF